MRFPYLYLHCRARAGVLVALALSVCSLQAASVTEHPFRGITIITRQESSPRNFTARIVQIDLSTPGLRFKLTPHSGKRETVRQTTLEFLTQEHAQLAINAHFFLPYPSKETDVYLIGIAASEGNVYSEFEFPGQSYAIVAEAPAINIDRTNHASVVHWGDDRRDLWTSVSGSAQILTGGKQSTPLYKDAEHPDGLLTEGGPAARFSNQDSWYERPNARTAIAIADGGKTLVLVVVDRAAGSLGLTVPELARILAEDYNAIDALNLDGGGSSTLAMEDPGTHAPAIVNHSSDNPKGRSVASSLAVFAEARQ